MNANVLIVKKNRNIFDCSRKAMRESSKISFRHAYIATGVLISLLVVTYVYLLNLNATRGYAIRGLENDQKNALFQENLLNIKIAEAQSIDRIQNHPIIKRMKSVDKPQYISAPSEILSYDHK